MPKIYDVLLKREGFKYATSIEINMRYYQIYLSEESSNLFTIILPWGKYQYKLSPMGDINSPEIFQDKMMKILCVFEFI